MYFQMECGEENSTPIRGTIHGYQHSEVATHVVDYDEITA